VACGDIARLLLAVPHLGDALFVARWLTNDRADAEDVVQEACLRAFRSIETFAGGNASTKRLRQLARGLTSR
jgi:DNA-directed RNA polymerase specialized sigma24 family protein